jgi:hypothetical protein
MLRSLRFLALVAALTGAACTGDKVTIPTVPGAPSTPTGSTADVQSVTVTPPSVSMSVGDVVTVTASVTAPASVTDKSVTWSSSNTNIATVDPKTGVVKAVNPGTCTIVATSNANNSKQGAMVLTVSPASAGFVAYSGKYAGEVTQVINLSTCPSTPSYVENIDLLLNVSGSGTAKVTDTPGFERDYQIVMSSSTTGSGSGTFSFLGTPVPGQLTIMFVNGTTMTFQEKTTYGTGPSACSNVFTGPLAKQ